jgi:flagellar basal body-associated protein FliL
MPEETSSRKEPRVTPRLKKMLMLAVIGLLLLALLLGGGWFGYRKFKAMRAAKAAAANTQGKDKVPDSAKVEEDEDAEEPVSSSEGEEGKSSGPAILVYKNNLNLEGKKNAYLVVELHILFRDAELGKAAISEKSTVENSMIRAMLFELLSGKSLEEASDMETREAIRLEIKDKLNEKFAPKPLAYGEKVDKKKKKPKHPIKDVLVVSWAIAQ